MMPKISKTRKEECRAALLAMLKPGDKVYCILRNVSRSGMSRRIDLYTMGSSGPDYISAQVADLLEYPCRGEGIVISGCGMDMGFQLVYQLGSALWPDGTPEPHGRRNGEPDSAGGYALKHNWL